MPITFDIENDALVKIGIDRERRKIIEAMLEEGSLSIKQVSSITYFMTIAEIEKPWMNSKNLFEFVYCFWCCINTKAHKPLYFTNYNTK